MKETEKTALDKASRAEVIIHNGIIIPTTARFTSSDTNGEDFNLFCEIMCYIRHPEYNSVLLRIEKTTLLAQNPTINFTDSTLIEGRLVYAKGEVYSIGQNVGNTLDALISIDVTVIKISSEIVAIPTEFLTRFNLQAKSADDANFLINESQNDECRNTGNFDLDNPIAGEKPSRNVIATCLSPHLAEEIHQEKIQYEESEQTETPEEVEHETVQVQTQEEIYPEDKQKQNQQEIQQMEPVLEMTEFEHNQYEVSIDQRVLAIPQSEVEQDSHSIAQKPCVDPFKDKENGKSKDISMEIEDSERNIEVSIPSLNAEQLPLIDEETVHDTKNKLVGTKEMQFSQHEVLLENTALNTVLEQNKNEQDEEITTTIISNYTPIDAESLLAQQNATRTEDQDVNTEKGKEDDDRMILTAEERVMMEEKTFEAVSLSPNANELSNIEIQERYQETTFPSLQDLMQQQDEQLTFNYHHPVMQMVGNNTAFTHFSNLSSSTNVKYLTIDTQNDQIEENSSLNQTLEKSPTPIIIQTRRGRRGKQRRASFIGPIFLRRSPRLINKKRPQYFPPSRRKYRKKIKQQPSLQ